MKLSYWEHKTWFTNVDFTVVGSGIVGLSCALFLKQKYPKSKILVLERGLLPQGASTKNAGFACFGSISEILSDLKNHSEEEVQELVRSRFVGIQQLRNILGDETLAYKQHKGHEVFLQGADELFEECLEKMEDINKLLKPVFKEKVFQNTIVDQTENQYFLNASQDYHHDSVTTLINIDDIQLIADSFEPDGPESCNIADLVEPFGITDLDDIDALIPLFVAGDPAADFVPPMGIVDLDDLDAFIAAFLAGCP